MAQPSFDNPATCSTAPVMAGFALSSEKQASSAGNKLTTSQDNTTKAKRVALIENIIATLFAVIGIGALCTLVYLSVPAFGGISDLPEYYAPAKLVLEGHGADGYTLKGLEEAQHRLYPSMGQRVVPLFVPPQGLALLTPIALMPPDVMRYAWKFMLAGCLGIAIILLKKTFKLNYKQTCYLLAAIGLSDAAYNSLRIDQLAPMLLLSYIGAIYCLEKKNDIGAGFLLALFVLKPQQLLPFLAYLAGAKRFKALLICAAIFALLSVVAFVQMGPTGISNYMALVSAPSSVPYMQPELNPTVRGQLLRLFPEAAPTIFTITSALYLATIALGVFIGWQFRKKENALRMGALGFMPLALVASMHCHTYDLLLLIPTIIMIFNDSLIPFGQSWKLAVMLGTIVFVLPVSIEIQHGYLLKGGTLNPWFFLLLPLGIALFLRVWKQAGIAGKADE